MKPTSARRRKVNPAIFVAAIAMGFVVYAFTQNSNPYVSFAEAKTTHDDRLHVVGDVVPGTVHRNIFEHTLSFDMTDTKGTRCKVTHKGEMPNNMDELKRVVVVGHMVDDSFVSQQMLIKCPTKYDDTENLSKPGLGAKS